MSSLSASNIISLCLASLDGLGKLCPISSKILCRCRTVLQSVLTQLFRVLAHRPTSLLGWRHARLSRSWRAGERHCDLVLDRVTRQLRAAYQRAAMKTLLCGGNPATLIRARQQESNAVRHHPQYLQGRRAFEDRIVRRRDIVSEYRNAGI